MSALIAKWSHERVAIQLEQEACAKLLEAACMRGNQVEIDHLRSHAHTLLDKHQEATVQLYRAIKNIDRKNY